jgi:L-threonylcarbamoyladenylate synthase
MSLQDSISQGVSALPKDSVLDIAGAVSALERGGVVVMPTDTVYGLAVMPGIAGGVEMLFQLKGRPEDKPIAILAGGLGALSGIGMLDERARQLAARFWPGPVTIVVPRAPGFEADLGEGRGVALRVPDCPPALDLLGFTGPLAVTSANHSGQTPATTVAEARSTFGAEVDVYIDGGNCSGAPSTVVSLLDPAPRVVREGPVSFDDITAALGG